MTRLITAFLLILSFHAWGQDHLLPKEFEYRLSNGMDLVLVEDPTTVKSTVFLSGRIGPYMEDSTIDGSLMVCFNLLTKGLEDKLSGIAKVDGYMSLESFMFSLSEIDKEHLKPTLSLINSVFKDTWWDSTDVETAKAIALQNANTDPLTQVVEKLNKQLWNDHYTHMSELASADQVMSIDSQLIASALERLFCPSLMHLTVHTASDHRDLRTFLIVDWNDWTACHASNITTSYVPSYNAMPFTLQNLVVKPIEQPTFLYLVQGPSAFLGQKQLMFGTLIEELVGTSDTVAMLADSAGLSNIKISRHGDVYASDMLLSAQNGSDSSLSVAYVSFMSLIDSLTDTNRVLFTNIELARAKAVLVDLFQDTTLGTHRSMLLSKHWSHKQEEMVSDLSKYLNELTAKDMIAGLHRYLKGSTYASAVVVTDSTELTQELETVYCSTDKSIVDHVFHFKKNTGQYSDTDHVEALNELYQFMRYNDFRLQVVGLSSKAELGTVEDPEMAQYFNNDSIPFMITSGRKYKNNRIPLELYRVMVILRYLLDRGIAPERLLGTGMRLPKKDPFIERAGTVNLKLQYW